MNAAAKLTEADLDARIAEWHDHRAAREVALAEAAEKFHADPQQDDDPDRPWGHALLALSLVGACFWIALVLSTLGARP